MAIRPNALPAASTVSGSDAFIVDRGSAVEKATPAQIVDAAIPLATQEEAETGANNTKRVTPLRVKQAIDALGVSAENLASTATGKGAELVGFKQSGASSVARTLEAKARETFSSADNGLLGDGSDETTGLANLATDLATAKKVGRLGVGTFDTSATVILNGAGNTLSGLRGEAPERSIISMTANGDDAVQLTGQYTDFSGFTVQYETQQTRSHTPAAAVLLGTASTIASFAFASLDRVFVKNAYYGFKIAPTAGIQQNNNIGTLRAYDCFGAGFDFSGLGSGSVYRSLYASNIELPNVLNVARFGDFSGTVELLNAEHSTVSGAVVDFDQAQNFKILSLHTEGLSLMRNGATLDVAATCCFIRTSGKGAPGIGQWSLDSSHIGALIVKPGLLTRSGTTARAYLETMGFQQKENAGPGIEVGDQCFIEGADTGTSNEYNGAQTVTAVGEDGSGFYIEFEVSGSPSTPADIVSGSDCITVSRGGTLLSSIPLVYGTGAVREFHIDSLYCRDLRTIGATASRRQNMLRFMQSDTTIPFTLRVGRISTEGQRSFHAYWLGPRTIVGYSRATNVSTIYFARPHGLRSDSPLIIYGATDTSFNGAVTGTLTLVSPYVVSFAQTAADVTLIRDSATRAILRTFAISTVSRTSNYATYTFSAVHGLDSAPIGIGLRLSIQAQDSAYTVTDGLILDVPSTTSVVLRNAGSDEGSKADSGGAMLIEGGLSESSLTGSSLMGRLVLPDEWITYQTVLGVNAVTAGTTVVQATDTVLRATSGRHRVEILSVTDGDARLLVSGAVSGSGQVQISHTNPTAGNITPSTAAVVTYRILGD